MCENLTSEMKFPKGATISFSLQGKSSRTLGYPVVLRIWGSYSVFTPTDPQKPGLILLTSNIFEIIPSE